MYQAWEKCIGSMGRDHLGNSDLHITGMTILKWILDIGVYACWGELSLTFSVQSYRSVVGLFGHARRVIHLK
jgi:hypothetical protein